MKTILIYYLVGIILYISGCSCTKEKNEPTNFSNNNLNCLALSENQDWNIEDFKENFIIQFPANYIDTGMFCHFEGCTFSKKRDDNTVTIFYNFCSPTFCFQFGDTLYQPEPDSIIITDTDGSNLTLNNRISFCKNDTLKYIFYYNKKNNSIGKLYMKINGNNFYEALTVNYELILQREIENILKTINKK